MKTSFISTWLARGAIIGSLIGVCCVAMPVSAATFRGGDSATVGTNETVAGDVYDTGSTVSMLGNVQGDFVAAGGTIAVQGPVDQSLLAAGGTLTLLGPVADDIRAAGGNIVIGGKVVGDVVVAGGTVHILQGAVIGGDVVAAGGSISIDGAVGGKVYARGGQLTINGPVGKGIDAQVRTLRVGPAAQVAGGITYTAESEAVIASSSKVEGAVTFTQSTSTKMGMGGVKSSFFGFIAFLALAKFVGLAILALLGLWLFKGFVTDVSKRSVARLGMSTLLGFVAMVVTPLACVVVAITGIGIYVAIAGMFAYGLFLFVGGALAMPVAGAILSRMFLKTVTVDWKWTLLGVLAFIVLTVIPVIGWIIEFVIYFMALGALLMVLHERYEK